MTTYAKQAANFNWNLWELFRELQREGLPVPRIAARFGTSPCKVRQHLENGERLSGWRDKS